MTRLVVFALLLVAVSLAPGSSSSVDGTSSLLRAGCPAAKGTSPVARPRFVRTIKTGETGWFSSPGLVDLDGNGRLEIVAPFYSTFVFDARGRLLGKGTATKGRVYAPGVVADLDARQADRRSWSAEMREPWPRTSSAAVSCGSSAAGRRRRAAAASVPKLAGWRPPISIRTDGSRPS